MKQSKLTNLRLLGNVGQHEHHEFHVSSAAEQRRPSAIQVNTCGNITKYHGQWLVSFETVQMLLQINWSQNR